MGKNTINVAVRLYWQHDPDLIMLKNTPNFLFVPYMREAVEAYAQGNKNFFIPLPVKPDEPIEIENVLVTFQVSESRNPESYRILSEVRPGFRANLVKQIFRYYLQDAPLDVYFDQETYKAKHRGTRKAIESTEDAPAEEPKHKKKKKKSENKKTAKTENNPAEEKEPVAVPEPEEKKEEERAQVVYETYSEPEEEIPRETPSPGFSVFRSAQKLME